VEAEVLDGDAGVVQLGRDGRDRRDAVGDRRGDAAGGGVDAGRRPADALEDRGDLRQRLLLDADDEQLGAAHLALEAARVAAGDDRAVVDDDDLVGEPVGLLEVLRRQQQCGAAVDEQVEHAPQLVACAWVEAGGRLVEEEHGRVGHERRGEVEPAAHAARVLLGEAVAGVAERELLEQLVGAALGRLAPEVVQLADHHEVLAAGEQAVDGRVLRGEADAAADLLGLGHDVVARDPRAALVGRAERGEDADGGRLAGSVRAEQPADRACGHRQVDAAESVRVPVALLEAGGLDGVRLGHGAD
jgi:hypothetical protein